MKKIDKNSSVNCIQQLKESIRELIRKNYNDPNYTIPSEKILCDFHQISRGTVRVAIERLVDEGLLVKRPGKGTFINRENENGNALERNAGLIAFVTAVGYDSYLTSELTKGMEKTLESSGYFLVLKSLSAGTDESMLKIIQKRCEGFIIYASQQKEIQKHLKALKKANYPFVMVDRHFPGLDLDYVEPDNIQGGQLAIRHLAERGCKSFLHFSIKKKNSGVIDRVKGFLSEAKALKIRSANVEYIDSAGKLEDQYAFIKKSLAEKIKKSPLGILAGVSSFSHLIFRVANELNLRIPEDIKIIGFHNVPSFVDLQISTLSASLEKVGEKAAEILLDKVEKRRRLPVQEKLPYELQERKSTQ